MPAVTWYIRFSNFTTADGTTLAFSELELGDSGPYTIYPGSASTNTSPTSGAIGDVHDSDTGTEAGWAVGGLGAMTITYQLTGGFSAPDIQYIRQAAGATPGQQITSLKVETSSDNVTWTTVHESGLITASAASTYADWTAISLVAGLTDTLNDTSDAADALDSSASTGAALGDSADMVGVMGTSAQEDVAESAIAADMAVYSVAFQGALEAAAAVVSALPASISTNEFVGSTADVTTALSSDIGYWLYGVFGVVDAPDSMATTSGVLAESAQVRGAISVLLDQLVLESVSATDTWFISSASQLVELVIASGLTTSRLDATSVIAQLVVALDLVDQAKLGLLNDAAAAQDVAHLVSLTTGLLERAVAASATTSHALLLGAISESIQLAAATSVWADLSAALDDGAALYVQLQADGEVISGWVMNAQLNSQPGAVNAVSEYQGLPINSMAKLGTRYFAAMEGGIYEMTGSTDGANQIATYIQTGRMDFGASQEKGLTYAYLGVALDGRVAVGVSTADKLAAPQYWYELTRSAEGMENAKVPLGRGLKGRYYKFDIAGEGLETFEAATVLPVILTRRI